MRRNKSRQYLIAPVTTHSRTGEVEYISGYGFRWGKDGGEIVFPAVPTPQVIAMGNWPGREPLVESIGKAMSGLYGTASTGTRKTIWHRVRRFLQWIDQTDPDRTVSSDAAISQETIENYLREIKERQLNDNTRRTLWYTFQAVIQYIDGFDGRVLGPKRLQIPKSGRLRWPPNPFSHAHERHTPTEPLTIEETASLLRVCADRMDEVWAGFKRQGERYGGPFMRDIYPFLYAAALITGMNPDTIRGLHLSSLTTDGLGRMVLRGAKPRAGKDQQATISVGDNSALDGIVVFQRVIALTEPLRDEATKEQREYLWLARTGARGVDFGRICAVKDLWATAGRQHSGSLGKQAGIEHLNLKRMRATAAELIRMLDGGISITAILGNAEVTANSHYKSPAARRREQGALARQMEIRWRFSRTDGLRDVRDRYGAPQSAATPGFVCADPFEPPPELGQAAGMCSAFLACPTCPQAGLNIDSPKTASELLNLKRALHDARDRLPPARWRAAYLTAFEVIESCLEQFDASILEESALLPVTSVPELE